VPLDQVALAPECTECKAIWLRADEQRWRLYLGVEKDLDEQPELVWLCPDCAAREFGR
jgi:hypothetical protein